MPKTKKVNRKTRGKRKIKKDESDETSTEKQKKVTTKRIPKSKDRRNGEIYPCDKCQRKLISKLSYIKHQEMHLKKDQEELEFKCNVCEQGLFIIKFKTNN